MKSKTPMLNYRSEMIECSDLISLCEAIDGGNVTIEELMDILRLAIERCDDDY